MRKLKKTFAVISVMSLSLILLPSRNFALEESKEELVLYLGETKLIGVSNPTRIVLGNPEVADVVSVTKSDITISPKKPGSTTLVLWDNFGEQSLRIIVFAEDMKEIKRRMDAILDNLKLPNVYTEASDEESKVMVLGDVKTAQDRERLATALVTLKDRYIDLTVVKEEEAIVEIDVQVLELSKDATNTLGFSWPGSINVAERGSAALTGIGSKWSTLFQATNFQRATVSAGTYTIDPFIFKLDLLVQEGKARILSRPRLACQSGKEAELLVGGEKPVFTTTVAATTGAQGTSVEYKEFGIKLNIKPTVVDNRIKLALNVEVSEVGTAETIGTTSTGQTTAQAYPLTKRNASTELYLDNGQTMAIGGLIKRKDEEDIRKTPFLGDLPILGSLFRRKTTRIGGGTGERGNVELFITLTPTIISKGAELQHPAKATKKNNTSGSLSDYTDIIQKKILDNLDYPSSAKKAGFEGTVRLNLRLSYNGRLLDAAIKDSSGYKILDDNTIGVAKKISSFPPFPASIESKEIWVEVPIVYQLD